MMKCTPEARAACPGARYCEPGAVYCVGSECDAFNEAVAKGLEQLEAEQYERIVQAVAPKEVSV